MIPFTLLLLYAHVVGAVQNVSTPETVTAGVPFPVTVTFDGKSSDDGLQNYRLYLNVEEKITWPLCYLSPVFNISTEITTTNITIPAVVGPPGNVYHVFAMSFNGTGYEEDGNQKAGHAWSTNFSLEGTNVTAFQGPEWSGPEREYDSIPCSAMQCNRDCKVKYLGQDSQSRGPADEAYCVCLAGCQGVNTTHSNTVDGCAFAWNYMKTAGPALSTANIESIFATALPTTEWATTTPTKPIVRSTGAAAQAYATGNAYAALAVLALL